MNFSINADLVKAERQGYGQITVELEGVEKSELLDHFTLDDVLDHFGSTQVLDHIGEEEVKEHFDLIPNEQ